MRLNGKNRDFFRFFFKKNAFFEEFLFANNARA